jgi:hypothetical protein
VGRARPGSGYWRIRWRCPAGDGGGVDAWGAQKRSLPPGNSAGNRLSSRNKITDAHAAAGLGVALRAGLIKKRAPGRGMGLESLP